MTLRAAPTTPTASTRRGIALVRVTGAPPRANRHGDPLHHAAMVMASRIHSIIDREVAADQIVSALYSRLLTRTTHVNPDELRKAS
ncbi:hypothetical protein PISL3812_09339 [Talaromyces islandicus]|uniref:Uncharacterized protein n=1 Tax=Talaromyces islandicus TaxID=28573 RepID=A0A0U1MAF6_TALIS|nr:hypothetical protein PISL3812_09339 [Talaromyces islandicus]